MTEPDQAHHYVTHEPKFCRCRVCHARFYGETIEEARAACLQHAEQDHPDWGAGACYCPD